MIPEYVTGIDGLPVLVVGQQALDKHFFIERYMNIFTTGMKGKWSKLVYIDLFAGPGKCALASSADEQDGSPLLALKTKYPFTDYFFNDREPLFAEALEARCAAFTGGVVTVLKDDCNAAATLIARSIPPGSLCLAFVDPFNWEIKFESLADLTRQHHVDLIITFHSANIKRAADYNPAGLQEFFGDPRWKAQYDVARASRQGTRALLDCYESSLRGVGYPHVRDQVCIKNSRGIPLYRLVLASKHPRAPEFWDKISARDRGGQGHLF